MIKIGAGELAAAVEGHLERTTVFGPNAMAAVSRMMESVGVDGVEFHAMAVTIKDLRDPEHTAKTRTAAYAAGFVDAALLMTRAATIAAERQEDHG